MQLIHVARVVVPALLSVAVLAGPANAETPAPSPSASPPCAKPAANYFTFTPEYVAKGDTVQVSGSIEDLWFTSQPSQTLTVHAQRASDTSPVFVTTTMSDEHGRFAVDVTVQETETLLVSRTDGGRLYYQRRSYSSGQDEPVVKVTRSAGSCIGVVTLAGPTSAAVGSVVSVHGTVSDTSTVSILFRKRGQNSSQVRRTLTPAADGTFDTTFVADDDYRLYASVPRCDSYDLLVQAQPVMAGPATTQRGSTVRLVVRAPAGVPVKVYFHRAGSSGYIARRSGTVNSSGTFATSYVADADYRYYAVTGPGSRTSNIGLTQTHR